MIAAILGEQTGLELSHKIADFGNTLMNQKPIVIVVYSSLATERTDVVSLEVPICNVGVVYANQSAVVSQVTAQFMMNDGIAPFYDLDLHFEATVPPLSYATFTITPLDNVQHCGGGDMDMAKAGVKHSFTQHVPVWPPSAAETPSAMDAQIDALIADQRAMLGESEAPIAGAAKAAGKPPPPPPRTVAMENAFMKVYVDTAYGLQAVFDKGSGKNYSATHQLMEYESSVNDA